MIGKQYGFLTIVAFSHKIRNSNFYVCLCTCGKEITRVSSNLGLSAKQARLISCGCHGRIKNNSFQCTKCNKWKNKSEFFKDSRTSKGHTSSCKLCRTALDKRRNQRPEVREKQRIKQQKWSKKESQRNPLFKIKRNMSRRLNLALQVKSYKKDTFFMNILGCSLEHLKTYLEAKFKPGMSWKNHGFKGWHIDHVVPLSSAQTKEELYSLCHYSNLQPLWACDNLSKGSKI